MTKYIITLGLNDKDTKKQIFGLNDAIDMTFEIISNHANGATITPVIGMYKHDSGERVIENSLKIELLFIFQDTALCIARDLGVKFNQESIVLETIETNSELFYTECLIKR